MLTDEQKTMVEDNLPLAIDRARKIHMQYSNKLKYLRVNLEDLQQVACVELMIAIKNFKPEFGNKLSTYAVPCIDGRLIRYIHRNNSLLKIPRLDTIKGTVHEKHEQLIYGLVTGGYDVGITDPVHNERLTEDKDVLLTDVIPSDEDKIEDMITRMFVKDFGLSRRELEIINLYFYKRICQREIGNILKISQVQVSRILRKSLKKLRSQLEKDNPFNYSANMYFGNS